MTELPVNELLFYEAVTAGFLRRLGAFVIDGALFALVAFLIGRFTRSNVVFDVLIVLLGCAYLSVTIGVWQQTVGHRVCGLQVIDDVYGGRIGTARALGRVCIGWISFLLLLMGYLSMVADKAGQTWHDKVAHSVVVDRESLVLRH